MTRLFTPHLALRVRSPALIPKTPATCVLLSHRERIEVKVQWEIRFYKESASDVYEMVINPKTFLDSEYCLDRARA